MPEASIEEPKKEESVKSYASKVFKESTVSAVSAIVSTGSIPRKIFRALIFVLFIAGFLYQCIKFLAYVLTYPTVVSIEIRKPEFFMPPAYTFCSNNKIKRSKYCSKYPQNCMVPDEAFCDNYPIYCLRNVTQVVKPEFHDTIYEFSPEEVLELSHDLTDIYLKRNKEDQLENNANLKLLEEPEGPFLRYRAYDGSDGMSACFSYQSRVDSTLEPRMQKKKSWWNDEDQKFTFFPSEEERFNPNLVAGILLSVHSQFDASNPFSNGIFLKPGYYYNIKISMYQEKLLEPPYETKCVNYTKVWLENGRRGPRSEEMCLEKCEQDEYIRCYNCTHLEMIYPTKYKYCKEEDRIVRCKNHHDDTYCLSKCRDECLRIKYDYLIRSRKKLPIIKNGMEGNHSTFINVFIDIDDSELYSFEYKPQYQEVEAFSYIGGFIGIWLGISLVQVADFFESAFRIMRYFFRKAIKKCRGKSSIAC